MKLLHNLIERYRRYKLKERSRRLASTNRKHRPMSIYPNAPVSPSEEQEGDYEQELNWHNAMMEGARIRDEAARTRQSMTDRARIEEPQKTQTIEDTSMSALSVMLSKLEARLENEETSAIKQAGALVKERFNTYQEELEYYAREKRGIAVWQKWSVEQTPMERVYTRTLNELNNLGAELQDPKTLAKRVIAVLKEIEGLRGNAVIAYFAAYGYNRNGVRIADEDLDPLTDMIESVPSDIKKLDLIIHSPGGLLEPAVRIVKLLRSRFEEVNFLIPRNAYSAATMMAMSADRIIMHYAASFSPYDPLTLSGSGEYLRTPILKIVAKDALRSFEKNPSNAMLAFPGWTKELARTRPNDAAISDVRYRRIAALWLVKYMFGHSHIKILDKCNAALLWSVLRALFSPRSRKDTLKAKRIVKFFTNIKLHLSHDDPLTYQDINDLGLNVSLADGKLKDYMREAYLLNKAIFDHSQISKCWFSATEHLFSWWVADPATPAV
jgi:hypothetical protein